MTSTKWLAVALVCLLPLSCRKTEEPVTTATAATDTATTVSDTSDAASRAALITVQVRFKDLVAHVVDSHVRRAVIVRAPGHRATAEFPIALKGGIEGVVGQACGNVLCRVRLDGLAFRFVDPKGVPLTGFKPSAAFASTVTHLTAVPSTEKPFELESDLDAHVDGDISKSGPVASFFELDGGAADVVPFDCKGKFAGQSAYVAFPMEVIVDYAMPKDSKLQVMRPDPKKAAMWVDVATISAAIDPIKVTNMPTANAGSHFDQYALLSKKKNSSGAMIDLPDVDKDATPCNSAAGDVPGCSNSAWP